ncbi:MAG: M10 family metallopeptidase C-terminal domain-containing protein, partial [Pseudomonadota bacterium]
GSTTYTATGVNAYEQTQLWSIFEGVEGFIDVDFEITTNRAEADLEWATAALPSYSNGTLLGFFYFPSSSGEGGFGILNDNGRGFPYWNASAGGTLDTGGFMYGVAVHELGHGLGLGHPHDTGNGTDVLQGVSWSGSRGSYDLNMAAYTAMSYNQGSNIAGAGSVVASTGHGATFAALDIAALQNMYGANTTHAAGDDVYELVESNFTGSGAGYYTVWDTGGTDAFEYTGRAAATIDLRAATLAYEAGGGGFLSYLRGTVGGWTIANGVVIENATSGDGYDTLTGNAADNVLSSGKGNDTIEAGAGDDVLRGGQGSDILYGGLDDDTLIGGSGADRMYGGTGEDMVDYSGSALGVTIHFDGSAGLGGDARGDRLYGIEKVVGSEFSDTFIGVGSGYVVGGRGGGDSMVGSTEADILAGGAGADQMSGDTGDDTLMGDDGDDRLLGDEGEDHIYGGANRDQIFGGSENDTLHGGSGDDSLSGTIGDDVLYGGDGADFVAGNRGLDVLYGGWGRDTLKGNELSDWLFGDGGDDLVYGGTGDDTLTGGAGADRMYGGTDDDTADYSDSSAEIEIRLGGAVGSGGDAQGDRLFEIEHLVGSDFGDVLIGDRKGNTIDGRDGADSIIGAAGDDALSGGASGDQIRGNSGDDTLRGDAGNDRLIGDDDEDHLFGGADNDHLYGGNHNDTIDGGIGDDSIFGMTGADFVYGGDDDDRVAGNAGADLIYGGHGDDVVLGNEDADVLYGWSGDDQVSGGSGADMLYGGVGADIVDGGAGSDILTGGLDADVFKFSITGGIDQITDWQDGLDVLDFTAAGLGFGDFTLSALAGADGTRLVGGGYVVVFQGVPTVELDASDFL